MNTSTWGFGVVSVLLSVGILGCKERPSAAGDQSGTKAAAPSTAPITIGGYLSLTGDKATFGIETQQGAQLAFEAINQAGGIRGRKIEFVVVDDQGRGDEAANAVSRLIDINGAVAILGEVASTLSLQGGRVAQRKGVPMVSPSSTNEQVTLTGDYVFRVCFIDPFQGAVMARFARETLHMSRVAVLKDVRSDYSLGLSRAFVQAFTASGGTIVTEESYNAGDSDFSAQLTTIKGKGAEALFIPGYYTDVGTIARKARGLGITGPFLGGDGWDSPQLREIGGADIVGSYYSNHFAADNPTPLAHGFIERYKAKYNTTPSGLAALGYDAAAILIDALKRVNGEITPRAIRDALVATQNFPAVSGNITFDANRNPMKPAVVVEVTATGEVFKAQVDPPPAAGAVPSIPAPTGAPVAPTGTGAPAAAPVAPVPAAPAHP